VGIGDGGCLRALQCANERTDPVIPNPKFIGFTVVMAAVLSVSASTASAKEFKSEKSPATLTGAQEGTDVFGVQFGNISCTTIKYAGTQATSPATSVTIAPTYSGCVFTGLGMKITTNGCQYKFTITGESGGKPTGTIDIVGCEAGKKITVVAPAVGTTKCTVEVGEQTGVNGITYTAVGAGATSEITIDLNATNISYTQKAGTGVGACSATSASTGTYAGHTLVTGENASGTEHIGIFIS